MSRIKEILEEKNLMQAWLFAQHGTRFNSLNSNMQNCIQPSLPNLISIAKILKVSVKELVVE